jgi:hypothetical protein
LRGIEVERLSSDGDKKYGIFFKDLTELFSSLRNFDFGFPLHQQFLDFDDTASCSDLLHILKCVRYRFIEATSLLLFPDLSGALLSKTDFREIGTFENVLIDSKGKKQEDSFPLQLLI